MLSHKWPRLQVEIQFGQVSRCHVLYRSVVTLIICIESNAPSDRIHRGNTSSDAVQCSPRRSLRVSITRYPLDDQVTGSLSRVMSGNFLPDFSLWD